MNIAIESLGETLVPWKLAACLKLLLKCMCFKSKEGEEKQPKIQWPKFQTAFCPTIFINNSESCQAWIEAWVQATVSTLTQYGPHVFSMRPSSYVVLFWWQNSECKQIISSSCVRVCVVLCVKRPINQLSWPIVKFSELPRKFGFDKTNFQYYFDTWNVNNVFIKM